MKVRELVERFPASKEAGGTLQLPSLRMFLVATRKRKRDESTENANDQPMYDQLRRESSKRINDEMIKAKI